MVFVAPAHRRDGLAGRQRSRTPGVSLRGERRRKSITPTVTQRRPSAGSRQVEHVLQISDQPNAPSGATRGACERSLLTSPQPVPKRPGFLCRARLFDFPRRWAGSLCAIPATKTRERRLSSQANSPVGPLIWRRIAFLNVPLITRHAVEGEQISQPTKS